MRGILLLFCVLVLIGSALAVTGPQTINGKDYYIVTSTDPSEDTGLEVCKKVGLNCVGYTEPSSSVCKAFHPGAAESATYSGDRSGVYCDGAPQTGVCASETNTCHTCPACSIVVDCATPIGGLYREMFVECAGGAPVCPNVQSTNTQNLLREISSINAQLQTCPVTLPTGTGLVIANGNTIVDIMMTNGQTNTFTFTVTSGVVTSIVPGATNCKQRFEISEADLDSALASSNRADAFKALYANKKFKVKGCNIITRIKLALSMPISRWVLGMSAPAAVPPPPPAPPPPPLPPPPPAPNCGNVGEQCNNRACFSGICGAQKTQNSWGQWGYWHYECIDQRQYTALCVGQGNSPPPWSCLVGACR